MTSNIKELVLPYVEELKKAQLKAEYKTYVEILDINLANICSPFLNNLSPEHAHISSMEVQVANLIKAGKRNQRDSLNPGDLFEYCYEPPVPPSNEARIKAGKS